REDRPLSRLAGVQGLHSAVCAGMGRRHGETAGLMAAWTRRVRAGRASPGPNRSMRYCATPADRRRPRTIAARAAHPILIPSPRWAGHPTFFCAEGWPLFTSPLAGEVGRA